jgi:hypothetical protein
MGIGRENEEVWASEISEKEIGMEGWEGPGKAARSQVSQIKLARGSPIFLSQE